MAEEIKEQEPVNTEPAPAAEPKTEPATEPTKVDTPPTAEPTKTDLESNKTPNNGSDVDTKPSAPEVVQDNTEFKLPEGVKVDDEKMKAFINVAKELKLTKEQAQKLVDMDANYLVNSADKFYKDTVSKWKQDTLSQLGDNAEQKLGEAVAAYKKFGDDEFVKLMQDTGLENHPAVVRVFRNIGSKIATDTTVSATSNGVKSSKTIEELLYGDK